jgi:Sec-independent protein translocase protein TatA
VGFGTGILFMLTLGLVVLGPKRLHAMLGQVARAKAELENATRGIKSQLGAELDAVPREAKPIACLNQLGISEPSSDSRYRKSEPTA